MANYCYFSDLSLPCGERRLYDGIEKRGENPSASAASKSLFGEKKGVKSIEVLGNNRHAVTVK